MGIKNNFKRDESNAYTKYKLWVAYKPGTSFYEKVGARQVYRSHHCGGNHAKALEKLMKLYESRRQFIKHAAIYDFKTGEMVGEPLK